MITWKEACEKANYNPYTPSPEVTKTWIGYKQGEVQKFANMEDVRKFSNMYEVDPESTRPLTEFRVAQRLLESNAVEIWHNALREEFSELSEVVFDLCYSRAYDRGHSSGYDEVTSYMFETVEFAQNVIEASKQ